MANFTLSEVINATKGEVKDQTYQKVFTGVSSDTRTIQPGNLFVALCGEKYDGHNFLDEAGRKGAAGAIISRSDVAAPGVTRVVVPNTVTALQDLARYHRQRFLIPIVAVTGSNGKTTTKDMVASVLGSHFAVLKTEANFNNEIGLAQTLLQLRPDHEVAVVEMGMRAKGEIKELAGVALPTIAVVTNVSETHIELLGSLENIAAAKAELVEAIPGHGLVFLNADNHYVKLMQAKAKAKIVFYGLGTNAAIRAENIHTSRNGTTFSCIYSRGNFPVELATIGRHNVTNALAAIAVGLELGLDISEIQSGLKTVTSGKMRLHVEEVNGFTIINDAYNASPLSTAAAVETLADIARGRRIAVLGDMLELGPVAVEAHKKMGEKLVECKIDAVVTVGQLARHIAMQASQAGISVAVACNDHEEAMKVLQNVAKAGDTILIKGSRGMKMEKLLDWWH